MKESQGSAIAPRLPPNPCQTTESNPVTSYSPSVLDLPAFYNYFLLPPVFLYRRPKAVCSIVHYCKPGRPSSVHCRTPILSQWNLSSSLLCIIFQRKPLHWNLFHSSNAHKNTLLVPSSDRTAFHRPLLQQLRYLVLCRTNQSQVGPRGQREALSPTLLPEPSGTAARSGVLLNKTINRVDQTLLRLIHPIYMYPCIPLNGTALDLLFLRQVALFPIYKIFTLNNADWRQLCQ